MSGFAVPIVKAADEDEAPDADVGECPEGGVDTLHAEEMTDMQSHIASQSRIGKIRQRL